MLRQTIAVVVLLAFFGQLSIGKIMIRSKRQVERENDYTGALNESTVIVNGDREPLDVSVLPEANRPDTDVMEVDFDENDGTFSFGGRFPALPSRNFHNAMNNIFLQMTKRFEEMARGMAERFQNASSQYPANYNGTKEDIITMGGRQYIKKTHVIKKSDDNTAIFITSTSYEPVDETANES